MLNNKIAEHLLEIKAVYLQPNDPFTWASGIKSPIYCDNRLTLSYPEVRNEIAEGLKDLIEQHFPEAELIAGTATASIPHAAWVSEKIKCTDVLVFDPKPRSTVRAIKSKKPRSSRTKSGRCRRLDFNRRKCDYCC